MSSLPTLLLVTHYFPNHGGGIEIVAGQVARRLGERGWRLDWYASDVDSAPQLVNVSVHPQITWNWAERLGVPFPLWTPAAYARLVRAVRRVDVVHVHDCHYPANLIAALAAKLLGKRLVVTQHVGDVPYKSSVLRMLLAITNRVVARLVLSRADSVLFVSPVVRAYFERMAGKRSSFRVRPNGVDAEQFGPAFEAERARLRNDLGMPLHEPMALFVGRCVEKKGLALVRQLARRMPDWTWYLIGDGPIDPDEWKLPNVRKLGRRRQQDIADYYRAADILVLPSVGEGFPLVVQEALSTGCPVAVHTETWLAGGLWSEAGFSEPVTGDHAAGRWSTALRSFLGKEAVDTQRRRDARHRLAVRQWSWDAAVSEYADVLRGEGCASVAVK